MEEYFKELSKHYLVVAAAVLIALLIALFIQEAKNNSIIERLKKRRQASIVLTVLRYSIFNLSVPTDSIASSDGISKLYGKF